MNYKKLAELTHKMRHALAVAKRYEKEGREIPGNLQGYISDKGYWICTYAMGDIGEDCG